MTTIKKTFTIECEESSADMLTEHNVAWALSGLYPQQNDVNYIVKEMYNKSKNENEIFIDDDDFIIESIVVDNFDDLLDGIDKFFRRGKR